MSSATMLRSGKYKGHSYEQVKEIDRECAPCNKAKEIYECAPDVNDK